MYILCDCVGEYSVLYIYKTKKDRSIKFYAQYRINILIIFPGFGENRKTGSRVRQTGNEIGSEHLKSISTDFLQTRYMNTFLHNFLNVLIVYYRKIHESSNLVAQF